MLKAIINKKTKKPFEANEDSLTGSIFQLLSYLPDITLWKILRQAVNEDKHLPEDVGKLQSIEFWCKWDATETSNSNYIEPDVFMKFELLHLIVEAKKNNDNLQKTKQWDDEIEAYLNEFGALEKPVILLALGGIRTKEVDKRKIREKTILVIKLTWDMLLSSIKSHYQGLTKSKFSLEKNDLRLYKDLIDSFAYHQYFVGTWFDETDYSDYEINTKNISTLNNNPFRKITINEQ